MDARQQQFNAAQAAGIISNAGPQCDLRLPGLRVDLAAAIPANPVYDVLHPDPYLSEILLQRPEMDALEFRQALFTKEDLAAVYQQPCSQVLDQRLIALTSEWACTLSQLSLLELRGKIIAGCELNTCSRLRYLVYTLQELVYGFSLGVPGLRRTPADHRTIRCSVPVSDVAAARSAIVLLAFYDFGAWLEHIVQHCDEPVASFSYFDFNKRQGGELIWYPDHHHQESLFLHLVCPPPAAAANSQQHNDDSDNSDNEDDRHNPPQDHDNDAGDNTGVEEHPEIDEALEILFRALDESDNNDDDQDGVQGEVVDSKTPIEQMLESFGQTLGNINNTLMRLYGISEAELQAHIGNDNDDSSDDRLSIPIIAGVLRSRIFPEPNEQQHNEIGSALRRVDRAPLDWSGETLVDWDGPIDGSMAGIDAIFAGNYDTSQQHSSNNNHNYITGVHSTNGDVFEHDWEQCVGDIWDEMQQDVLATLATPQQETPIYEGTNNSTVAHPSVGPPAYQDLVDQQSSPVHEMPQPDIDDDDDEWEMVRQDELPPEYDTPLTAALPSLRARARFLILQGIWPHF